ncbi:DegT/DnrJ/EryC1/StrS family aminotransferase [Synechococcus sp. A15-24]|uniref:DegT/DnrJ/EryC1/StrS family aminotransferase n=1 Tax=Synechococcus sp. A15-24 TaxID=1050635 RepID=UPI00164751E1|nr:DegT/DnrJ/EryC1/StrS family aminotransferase [Synechococcus sp. A15-24]
MFNCFLYYRRIGLDPGYDDFFENQYTSAFASYMGGGYSDAVSSGCSSIYIALKSLSLPSGSLVATSPVTDASVIGCLVSLGLVPYLLDSDYQSYNTGIRQLKDRYIPAIKALVLTHAGGVPCKDTVQISEFCKSKNIVLIEDCSQAIGAIPQESNLRVGKFGRFGCFSTMYRKNLAAGGSSGLLYCTDYKDYQIAKQHADRGKRWWDKTSVDLRDPGFADFPGLNFNSDEIRCSIGLANLSRLPSTISKRKKFLSDLIFFLDKYSVKLFFPSEFHSGISPFYFPIFIDTSLTSTPVLSISHALKDDGLGIGVKYGCLVSTWKWASQYMYDKFHAPNALAARDQCFHLYLNENYTRRHARLIAKRLSLWEQCYIRK